MLSSNLKDKRMDIIVSLACGITAAWYFIEPITKLFFGLSFSGRSPEIQRALFIIYTFVISFISYAIFYFYSKHKKSAFIIISALFITCTVLFAARIFFLQYQIIAEPIQLEYREGAIQLITQALMEGKNIFNLDRAPLYTNGYGLIYNAIVLPFAKIIGNTLMVHRLISALFTLASAALIILTIYKRSRDWLVSFSGGILFSVSQLYWVIPTARPDSVGLFFFLLTILIPYQKKYTSSGLALSALFGLIAFLTKPYFVVAIPILAGYIFLFISKRKNFVYCIITAVLFIPTIFVVNLFFETYFYNILYVHTKLVTNFIGHALNQLVQFLFAYGPLIAGGLLITLHNYFHCKKVPQAKSTVSIGLTHFKVKDLSDPLIDSEFDIFLYIFTCSTLLVFFKFGRHIGSYMVYLFQLMTPFLIILILQRLHSNDPTKMMILPFILINILSFRSDYRIQVDYSEWDKAEYYITSSQYILNSPILTSMLIENDIPVVDSGQTQYFYVPLTYPLNPFLPDKQIIEAARTAYLEQIDEGLQGQLYDFVMISTWDSPFTNPETLQEYYELEEALQLPMPQSNQNWLHLPAPESNQLWEIEVWKPKRSD